ncbi:MAG: TlpA family protein disulfide reductase [Acidobacteria bacterium]|nr:TlpA family protein disulfide reductase [Acidobacteriota bacterium]
MRRISLALVAVALLVAGMTVVAQSDIVADVRAAIAAKDFARGQAVVDDYRSARGATPEMIEALSWLARGTFAAGLLDQAAQYSVDTYELAVAALRTRRLEDDVHLRTALGAAIETDALVRAARGDRSSAVYFLERELETYRDSPIHKRLQKNLNLLTLEGRPAPALDAREYLGPPVPALDRLKGNVVLLFFWAHWCPDCKAQGPIIERLLAKYRLQRLRVVAPTQRFGYIVSGQDAPPDAELRHIVSVRDEYYGFLRNEPVPVSDANHKRYGVSSTPTLALVDRQGIVRLYRPGRMTEEELEAAIRKLL